MQLIFGAVQPCSYRKPSLTNYSIASCPFWTHSLSLYPVFLLLSWSESILLTVLLHMCPPEYTLDELRLPVCLCSWNSSTYNSRSLVNLIEWRNAYLCSLTKNSTGHKPVSSEKEITDGLLIINERDNQHTVLHIACTCLDFNWTHSASCFCREGNLHPVLHWPLAGSKLLLEWASPFCTSWNLGCAFWFPAESS